MPCPFFWKEKNGNPEFDGVGKGMVYIRQTGRVLQGVADTTAGLNRGFVVNCTRLAPVATQAF